jgi:hypothetical protein
MQFAGFRARSFVHAPGLPETQEHVMLDTSTFTEGDAIKLVPSATVPGIDAADAVNDSIFGYLEGIVTPAHLSLELAKSSDYDGTFTQSPSGSTYVSASDNTTDKYISGVVRPALGVKTSSLLDAAIGTTAASAFVYGYFDILTTDSRKLDENTVSTTAANYISLPGRSNRSPRDPADPSTSRIITMANETQIYA